MQNYTFAVLLAIGINWVSTLEFDSVKFWLGVAIIAIDAFKSYIELKDESSSKS